MARRQEPDRCRRCDAVLPVDQSGQPCPACLLELGLPDESRVDVADVRQGQRILHYRLKEEIGKGGMGIVWRAEDTVLGREVALKFLPAELADDPDQLARFRREAKILAAFDHANLAAIYGVEEIGDTRFLVLEYVPGHSLEQRLKTRPLGCEEALRVCCAIARALEAAHAEGIVHRDLKPANVQLTPEGEPKVLDFGLAKPTKRSTRQEASVVTRKHAVLGTTPYMSPEQSIGKPVDRQTDIWAFGCLLYEALTGERAFSGETVEETLLAIQTRDADWDRLPIDTPTRIRALLRRCTEKDPDRRLHHIADARIEIEEALAAREWETDPGLAIRPPTPSRTLRRWTGITLVLALGLTGGFVFRTWLKTERTPLQVSRVGIALPEGSMADIPRISPDGSVLVFVDRDTSIEDPSHQLRLRIRRLGSYEESFVPGSEGTQRAMYAFSSDSRWVAFVAVGPPPSTRRRLFKYSLEQNAPPVELIDWPKTAEQSPGTLAWLPGGDLIVITGHRGATKQHILRVPSDGSEPGPPVEIPLETFGYSILGLTPLPDGEHVITMNGASRGYGLVSVETGEARWISRVGGALPVWLDTGHLLFSRSGALLAMPFDPVRLKQTGSPTPILDLRADGPDRHFRHFDVSSSGTLVYVTGGPRTTQRELTLVDEAGNLEPWISERRRYIGHVTVSDDGSTLATLVHNEETMMFEVWVSGAGSPDLRRLAFDDEQDCLYPALTSDGSSVIYSCHVESGHSPRDGIYAHAVDGLSEPVLLLARRPGDHLQTQAVSPDGRWLFFNRYRQEDASREHLLLTLDDLWNAGQARPIPMDSVVSWLRFSPDGRWIAYGARHGDVRDVRLRRFQEDGSLGKEVRVAEDASWPMWSKSRFPGGRLGLRYLAEGRIVEVFVEHDGSLSSPRQVGSLGPVGGEGDLMGDGRYIGVRSFRDEMNSDPEVHVVLNWFEELRARVEAGD